METHLQTLCCALRDRIDLTVLVAGDQRSTTIDHSDGFPVIRAGTWAHFASAPLCPALPWHIRKTRPDVLHLHMPHPTAIPACMLAAPRVPLVVTYHSDIVRQRNLARAIAPLIDYALRRASTIICTSPQYIESSPVLAHHRERCSVVPLSIDAGEFAAVDEAAVRAIRARYGPKLVLAAGRLVYYKGFEYLIRSMRQVDAHLLIIGNGPLLTSLQDLARGCGVAERTTFLDKVDDIAPWYHAADMFVLPSIARSEAFGIVQLEAMACGKPVVNTSLDTGVPFVSLDGVTGLTVPPADSEALAGAINLLLENPDLRLRLGHAARHRVQTLFSVPAMAESTLTILRQAAAAHNRQCHLSTAS
jgi:rhamnosyl/mannosyltransferase